MSILKNVSESGLIVTGHGKLKSLVINSHASGTVKIFDATESGVVATTDLTQSVGATVPANYGTATLSSTGNSAAASHAVTVFTSSGVVVAAQTITIGTTVYTARVAPAAAYDVAMGADAQAFLVNLRKAINGTGAGDNKGYADGTVKHPNVVASASDATTITLRGRVPGTSLDATATTETFTNGSFPDTTLGGGTGASDPGVTTANATVTIGSIVYTQVVELSETLGATAIAYQVLRGASEATYLDNLKLAINATGTAGTQYSTGTLVHPDVVATINTDTAQIIRTRTIGTAAQTTALNALATTETMANTAWGGATMSGAVTTDAATFVLDTRTYTGVIILAETMGLTAVPFQVYWVTSEAVFLDNIKAAVNLSGVMGTDYGTGTTEHPTVVATVNSNTVQTFNAKKTGTAGNLIATTETMANYAFTSTVMASGAGASGKVMHNTITFSAVATTGERVIDLGGVDFITGLYFTVGGTADLTVAYDLY